MRPLDAMLIGAQKSGTTSLLAYLGEHPQVKRHPSVEFGFFVSPRERERGYEWAYPFYFGKTPPREDQLLLAKSAALYHHEDALEALAQHNPHCKLLLVMRNPVERAFSSFMMQRTGGMEAAANFPDYLTQYFRETAQNTRQQAPQPLRSLDRMVIEYGKYDESLAKILRHFPREQLHLIVLEAFKAEPAAHLQHTFQFLGIDEAFMPDVNQVHNAQKEPRSRLLNQYFHKYIYRSKTFRNLLPHLPRPVKTFGRNVVESILKRPAQHKPQLSAEDRQRLQAFYRPHIERLAERSGLDVSRWLAGAPQPTAAAPGSAASDPPTGA